MDKILPPAMKNGLILPPITFINLLSGPLSILYLPAFRYLLPPPPVTRTGLYICRILTVIGLLLLLTGAVGIVIGYTWPHERLEESMTKVAVYQVSISQTNSSHA
jgi:hypothetical protein